MYRNKQLKKCSKQISRHNNLILTDLIIIKIRSEITPYTFLTTEYSPVISHSIESYSLDVRNQI